MASENECYSCGLEANPDSPRNFCNTCDSEFEAGLQRADNVVARAEMLETAKAEGDSTTVGEIMTEIFKESVAVDPVATQSVPTSSATSEKVSE